MIKLIWWRLRLLDAPWHQWTRMHACETAVCFGMVDLSLDGDVLCTRRKRRVNGAMHGGGLCALCGSVPCRPLTVPHVEDTVAATTAMKRHRSSRYALVKLAECSSRYRCHRTIGKVGHFCGAGVGPTRGLSEKSPGISSSSTHILYTHAPSRAVAAPLRRCTPFLITFNTELPYGGSRIHS